MKSLKQFVVAAIFAVLAGTSLHAQTIDMRATIPFDFHVGDRLMPAGEYLIHERGALVFLREADGDRLTHTLLTIRVGGADSGEDRLEFNRYGNEYFFAAVWNSFTRDGHQALPTAREKELAKREGVPAQATTILARNH